MYGNSDLFGKKKRKKDKVDFLTFRIVLYVNSRKSMRFHKTHQEGGVLYG